MIAIRGVYPVIPTPFDEYGHLAEDAFQGIIRCQVERGCAGVVLFGIASEFYKLTDEEERRLIDMAAQECAAEATQLVVSVTKHATRLAEERAQEAVDAGADALMLLPPFFLGPSEEEILEHVRRVGNAVDVPVIVQYAPQQTGVTIRPESFAELARTVPSLSCCKVEARPPGPYISALQAVSNGEMNAIVGYGGLRLIEAMDRGAIGVMPGSSLSDLYREVDTAYRSGDRSMASEIHKKLIPLISHMIKDIELFIQYEKRLLVERGTIYPSAAHSRSPSVTPDSYDDDIFEEYFAELTPYLERS